MAIRIESRKHGGPGVLKAVEFASIDPAKSEIWVGSEAIGINYIDAYIRSGLYPSPSLPNGLGTEAAGMVSKAGSEIAYTKAGDRMVYVQSALSVYNSIHNVPTDEAVILLNAISFEQAIAPFLKGLTVSYLLCEAHEIQPDELFLFRAAIDGADMITCQWTKTLGARLVGTVDSAQKVQIMLQAGAWRVINYYEESIVERAKEITGGKKVRMVHDSIGKDIWKASLDCLQYRGLVVSSGNVSGPAADVNLDILNQKGSLYVARPSLQGYITNHRELTGTNNELFSLIASRVIRVDVIPGQTFTLYDTRRAHEVLESQTTQESSLLTP